MPSGIAGEIIISAPHATTVGPPHVVPVMSDDGFRVEIFAADNVGGGPICTLAAPKHAVPFILHSAWMPRAVAAPDHERSRFADDLARVDELPDDLARVARDVAAELDHAVPML